MGRSSTAISPRERDNEVAEPEQGASQHNDNPDELPVEEGNVEEGFEAREDMEVAETTIYRVREEVQ